jgi:hypothetical protein
MLWYKTPKTIENVQRISLICNLDSFMSETRWEHAMCPCVSHIH